MLENIAFLLTYCKLQPGNEEMVPLFWADQIEIVEIETVNMGQTMIVKKTLCNHGNLI